MSLNLFVVCMNRISRCSFEVDCIWLGPQGLIFAIAKTVDSLPNHDLQCSLGCILVKCEARKMEISSSSAEIMIFDWKIVECFLLTGSESPSQVKECRYFGVWFRSHGNMENELD